MTHLDDKLAEFFYEELSVSEMSDARRHVAGCGECRGRLEQFETTHMALRSSADFVPPRHFVLAAPHREPRFSLAWRALVPLSAAAAAVVAAVLFVMSPVPAPLTVSLPMPAPVVVQAQNVDYARIVDEVRKSDRAWMAAELDKRDREIRQLQGQLVYYETLQRSVRRETLENASYIQLLAQRTETRN